MVKPHSQQGKNVPEMLNLREVLSEDEDIIHINKTIWKIS